MTCTTTSPTAAFPTYNCGHWIQQEQPEKVNSLLLEFLSEL
jgi:pimeloyl-ACP methyl ester carboxylesterase